jgi:hypothetical protein
LCIESISREKQIRNGKLKIIDEIISGPERDLSRERPAAPRRPLLLLQGKQRGSEFVPESQLHWRSVDLVSPLSSNLPGRRS